jgi:hypothetical protein
MITRLLLVLGPLIVTPLPAGAQGIPPLVLDSLITPASPALILLGASSVAIERPSTPKAVALTLASAIRDAEGLPKDLAVEFAPYWLTPHPRLTFTDYYRAGLAQRLLQTFGLSLGTSRLDPPADGAEPGTALAFGFRTTPFTGSSNPELAGAADSLRRIQEAFTREMIDLESDEEVQALWAAKYEAAATETGLKMQALDNERVGLVVDVAGALALDFPADVADSGFVSRAGVWIAPAYRPRDGAVEILTLARYVLDRRSGEDLHQFDFGARSIVNIGALAGSIEFVEHAGDELPNGEAPSYRLAANLDYRVGASSAISFTFGRDDRPEDGTDAGLIARLTLNLGFGPVPLLRLGGALGDHLKGET